MATLTIDLLTATALLSSAVGGDIRVKAHKGSTGLTIRNLQLPRLRVNARFSLGTPEITDQFVRVKYKVHALMGMPLGNRVFNIMMGALSAEKKWGVHTEREHLVLNLAELKRRNIIPDDIEIGRISLPRESHPEVTVEFSLKESHVHIVHR
jgi:hypothetical protein